MHVHMCRNMRIDMGKNMCTYMCIDMCMDLCIDTCMDMHKRVCRHAVSRCTREMFVAHMSWLDTRPSRAHCGLAVWHVYGHMSRNIHSRMCRHAYRHTSRHAWKNVRRDVLLTRTLQTRVAARCEQRDAFRSSWSRSCTPHTPSEHAWLRQFPSPDVRMTYLLCCYKRFWAGIRPISIAHRLWTSVHMPRRMYTCLCVHMPLHVLWHRSMHMSAHMPAGTRLHEYLCTSTCLAHPYA